LGVTSWGYWRYGVEVEFDLVAGKAVSIFL